MADGYQFRVMDRNYEFAGFGPHPCSLPVFQYVVGGGGSQGNLRGANEHVGPLAQITRTGMTTAGRTLVSAAAGLSGAQRAAAFPRLNVLVAEDNPVNQLLIGRLLEKMGHVPVITGNGQDAEEVVQDACWSVVRKIDLFRGDSTFGSWPANRA